MPAGSLDWERSPADRSARLALEAGLRLYRLLSEWAEWAAGHVEAGALEAALQRAEHLGGKRQLGPVRAPTGLVVGHFTDPEGNLIGVAGTA